MQQVKIFTGLEGATEDLSTEINRWIRETGVQIIQMTGNIAPQSNDTSGPGTSLPGRGSTAGRLPSDVIIIVLYEEK